MEQKTLKLFYIIFFVLRGALPECCAQQEYSPIGKMFNIGTHKLHLISTGEEFKDNSPTVILEHGLHCEATYWNDIQEKLTDREMHVCSYDRAGLGWSEVSPQPRTAENIVQDLDLLLEKADIPNNRIFVGHSFGGLCAQLYCMKHRNKVAGIVLVDSVHENMLDDMPSDMINSWEWEKYKLSWIQHVPAFLLGYLAADKEKNKLKSINYPKCHRDSRLENIFKPNYFSTLYNEMDNIYTSFDQVRDSSRSFGDIPLKVIIADDFEDVSAYGCGKLSNFDQATQNSFIATCRKHKQEQAERSRRGELIIAEGCSHRIPLEKPQIVVDAVLAVVEEVRNHKTINDR